MLIDRNSASAVGLSGSVCMDTYSQIVKVDASPSFHILGEAHFSQICQTVEMDQNKNGGPNHLKAWREKRALSQEALAEKVGTSASVISYLEQGERGLSAKWLRRLAPHLGITPGLLLDHDPAEISDDMIDIWASANDRQKQQLVEIAKTIVRDGTNG